LSEGLSAVDAKTAGSIVNKAPNNKKWLIIIKALILNGLGFNQRRLYMVSNFFSDKPIAHLLGAGIDSSHLNDTVIGRCLIFPNEKR
jgi:hypothetical protein